MARISVTRTMSADPTSTALLLGGPTALEAWSRPGVTVRLQSPWRTPTAYVSRVVLTGDELPRATGLLTLGYDADSVTMRTAASLRLDFTGVAPDSTPALELHGLAEGLLDALADVAEARAFAA